MASLAAPSLSLPTFSGLRASEQLKPASTPPPPCPSPRLPPLSIKASSPLHPPSPSKSASVALLSAAAAGLLLLSPASPARAIDVSMGTIDGGLVFIPKEFTVKAGEPINFINAGGLPHNVVFDEDDVPAGVDAEGISMKEEDLVEGKDSKYTVTLTTPGKYAFYCSPHAGSGMKGTVNVQ